MEHRRHLDITDGGSSGQQGSYGREEQEAHQGSGQSGYTDREISYGEAVEYRSQGQDYGIRAHAGKGRGYAEQIGYGATGGACGSGFGGGMGSPSYAPSQAGQPGRR